MGAYYVLGASLRMRPGININGQYLDLGYSSLLLLSVQNVLPTIFSDFQGFLDTGGQATAHFNIPKIPTLRGLRVFFGGVVIPNGKNIIVSNCEGLTIW